MARTPNFVQPTNPNPTMEQEHIDWIRERGPEFNLPVSLFLKKLIGGLIVFDKEKPNVLKAILGKCPIDKEQAVSAKSKTTKVEKPKKVTKKEEPKAKGKPGKKVATPPVTKKTLKSTKSAKPTVKKKVATPPTKKRKSLHR